MTLEIDCTTRTKQRSTLSVENLYRTRVRMLGPTLVPSVNSIVRTVIDTRKLQSLAATAASREMHWETQYGPLAHVSKFTYLPVPWVGVKTWRHRALSSKTKRRLSHYLYVLCCFG